LNMQNTNELWLGFVPREWQYFRVKDIAQLSPSFSNGNPTPNELCTVIPMEAVSEKGQLDTSTIDEFNLVTSGLTNFEVGDVIFAKITPCMENGKGAYVDKLPTRYALGSTEFHVLRPRFRIVGKFLYYYTYNSVYRDYAEANMSGAAGQKRISSKFINYTRIYLPPINEQRCIAAYLDKTCAAIDTAIEKKQKQLETLDALRKSIIHKAVTRGLDDSVELRDSGVEWIGKVPKHWQLFRLKDVAEVNGRALPATTDADFVLRYLEISNVNNRGIVSEDAIEEIAFVDAPSRARRIVLTGDTLISSVRPNLQAVAHITNGTDNFIASTGFYVVSPNHKRLDPKYTHYFLLSENTKQYLEAVAKGVGYPAVDDKDFTTLKCFLPPIPEQRQIVDYLDRKIAVLYDVQKNLTGQIAALELYRKSLIHECVTGKRRIAEDDLRENTSNLVLT